MLLEENRVIRHWQHLTKNDFLDSVLLKEKSLAVRVTLRLKASEQRVSDAQWASYLYTVASSFPTPTGT